MAFKCESLLRLGGEVEEVVDVAEDGEEGSEPACGVEGVRMGHSESTCSLISSIVSRSE